MQFSFWRILRPSVDFYAWLDQRRSFPALVVVLLAGLAGLLLTPDLLLEDYASDGTTVGAVSTQNIKAPFDLTLFDDKTTQRLRDEASRTLRRVYDYDTLIAERTGNRIAEAFAFMRQATDGINVTHTRLNDEYAARRPQFVRMLGTPLRNNEYAALRKLHFSADMEEALQRFVHTMQSEPLIGLRSSLEADRINGILLQRVPSDSKSHQLVEAVDMISDLDTARQNLSRRTAPMLPDLSAAQRPVLVSLALRLLEPNVSFNRAETERLGIEARRAISPVTLTVKKGEMIIRDGERLTPNHLLILDALRQSSHSSSMLLVAAGGALLLLVLIATAARFAQGYGRRWQLKARDLLFLASVFIISLGGARLGLTVTHALHEIFPRIPLDALTLALPLAAGTMLVRLVLRGEVALLFSLITSLMVGLLSDSDRMLSIYTLVGSVAATSAIRSISSRSDLLRAGIWVGVAQTATALGIYLFGATVAWKVYLSILPAAFLGGVLCGFVALSLAPLMEWVFGYTTDLKLLELSNLNHPALKELIVQAPGSYHHSIIVGALVEAAAESIGANPLLARVMAYYHDLGKGCNPMYFVENQRTHHNPHDKLKPSMSAMVIRRHVSDGIELAKRYALGEPILAGIAQHHGTTLIHYFYHKAREQAEDKDSVSEAEYRYPGQKPQTREAALVMVGDSIEAAARAMSEPSPARLQGLVTRIISNKFTDGQLEECDLTLRDLHTIAKAFSTVLASIYHHRVEYPDPSRDAGGKRAFGDSDPKSSRRTEVANQQAADATPDNLRRLGL
jgi:putative nucleotidyltransferase with HDIG domain